MPILELDRTQTQFKPKENDLDFNNSTKDACGLQIIESQNFSEAVSQPNIDL